MPEIDVIEKLLEIYDEEQSEMIADKPTMLEVLNKVYDENLVSRLIAYTIQKDHQFLGKLLDYKENSHSENNENNKNEFKSVTVRCEKVMDDGRADIYVDATDNSGKRYFLTIENKIWSEEHDNQTETYYKFVERQQQFKDCTKKYLFLTADFKKMQASCKHFKNITYFELLKRMSDTQDEIINNFKKHIIKYLSTDGVKFMNSEVFVWDNYEKIKEIMSNAENKWSSFKNELIDYLCNGQTITGLKITRINHSTHEQTNDNENGGGVFNLWITGKQTIFNIYRDEWFYNSDDLKQKYYIYPEIKFENNSPKEIVCQQILWSYAADSIVERFAKANIDELQYEVFKDTWYTVKREKYVNTDHELLSKEWQDDVKEWAKNTLNIFIQDMDGIFAKFDDFKKQQC